MRKQFKHIRLSSCRRGRFARSLPRLLLLALVYAGLFCSEKKPGAPAIADPSARRELAGGAVVGRKELYNSHAWLGIPYAAAPVGPLRWKAPEPAPAWTGERAAIRFGSVCPQLASALGGATEEPGTIIGQEDCLSLNVYAPRFKPAEVPAGEEALPVIVWIHGGANRSGGSYLYNGGNLAASEKLIVVSVNYRLAGLGWFRHPALAAGATREEASGNFTVLDLMGALRWVRANIAAFGGDAGNITIMGQSAGANNVISLLLSPRARGLFQRAIVQSAFPREATPESAANLSSAGGHENSSAEIAARLLAASGKASDLAAARALATDMPAGELAAFLRAQPAGRILDAFRKNLNGENPEATWYPFASLIRDGHVLPAGDWTKAIQAGGSVASVPIMIGANLDEDNLYLAIDDEYMQRLFGVIPRIREPDLYDAMGDHLSAAWRLNGVHRPARAIQKRNPELYAYRFDWDEEPSLFGTDLGLALGAAHAFEIPFVFGHYRLGSADRYMFTADNLPGREELSVAMMAYWASFARTGRPGGNRDDRPPWEPYGAQQRIMVFDTKSGGGRRMIEQPLTRSLILERVAVDPRLVGSDWRCRVYLRLAKDRLQIANEELSGWACPVPDTDP